MTIKSKNKINYLGPKSYKQKVFLTDNTTDIILYGGGAGAGKALRHGEKVLTPNGFVNIEDVRVGDIVTTPNNTMETVLDVWPQGEVPIYRVHFQDGRFIDTCGEHLWQFHIAGKGTSRSRVASTLDLKQIVDAQNSKPNGERRFPPIVPLAEPVTNDSNVLSQETVVVKQKDVGLRIEKIEFVGKDFATCIGISGEEKLFITTNYVVTHNSYCALLKQLELVQDADARICFIRNTRPQLIAPGALVDESKNIYMQYKPKFRSDILEYTFPSGCKISFKTINSSADLPGYDGTQFTRVIFDEVQNQYSEEAVIYLMSRLRSKSKAHHQMIFTANPRDCWLKEWVTYCLDEEGVPKPGTENIVRWFVRINNTMHWANSKEALLEKFPESLPISFRFIPATCEDNPVLLENNPGYLANLKSLKRSDQLRLWKGSWSITDESEGYFKREWVSMVDQMPQGLQLVRAWDLASSPEPGEGMPGDPDYSVGVLMGRSKAGHYYILDVHRFRKRSNEVIEEIIRTAKNDGLDDCQVVITKDPGAAGAYFASFLSRTLIEHGVVPKVLTMSGHKNKLSRFLPFASLAEAGNVFCLKAPWNKEFFVELERFTGGTRGQHDDQVDAVADATSVLIKQNTIPTFVLPSMTKASILS